MPDIESNDNELKSNVEETFSTTADSNTEDIETSKSDDSSEGDGNLSSKDPNVNPEEKSGSGDGSGVGGNITHSDVSINLSNFWVANVLKKTRNSNTNETIKEHVVKIIESDPEFTLEDNKNLVKARLEQFFDTEHLYQDEISYTLEYKSITPFLSSGETTISVPVASNNTSDNTLGNQSGNGNTGVIIT